MARFYLDGFSSALSWEKRAGGQSGAWAGSASDLRSGSDKGNGGAVVRRVCLSIQSALSAVQKPVLVVAALAPVLRGQPGRNAGDKDDTTRHLSGRSVRVLASGLALLFSASQMTTRERSAGNLKKDR